MSSADISDEYLFSAASMALDLAGKHCQSHTPSGESCHWYHGAWPYLRALRLISGIKAEADYFLNNFRALAGTGNYGRVLISGCADAGMLELLLQAYHLEQKPIELTVLEQCETPLRLNLWHAKRFNQKLEVAHCSVFDFASTEPYDLICTHSFLSFIQPDRLLELFEIWNGLLRHGGCLLTSQSLRPGYSQDNISFTEEQVNNFVLRAEKAVQECSYPMGQSVQELRHLAENFARCKSGYVLKSADLLKNKFERASFILEHFAPAQDGVQAQHLAANPDTYKSWNRYQILAIRA